VYHALLLLSASAIKGKVLWVGKLCIICSFCYARKLLKAKFHEHLFSTCYICVLAIHD
jgi:hypothetical protein